MDYSLQHHKALIGQPIHSLLTPSITISHPVLKANIRRLHDDVSSIGIAFRPHVKTLKCLEATRMMLGNGDHRKVVASTIPEILGVLPLAQEGLLDECLYGLPVYPSILPRLQEIRRSLPITLMIDSPQHIQVLEDFADRSESFGPWRVFIKVDVGSHRAGVVPETAALSDLVHEAQASKALQVIGFYCHAGHSYSSRSEVEVIQVLEAELAGVLSGAKLIPRSQPLIVSIGATPTAHAITKLRRLLPQNATLELHAGNFLVNNLQQVSTSLIGLEQQAIRICAEVCSVYPERNEALLNAGVIALSRETSAFEGFGQVVDKQGWAVVRLSQEHGIIGRTKSAEHRNVSLDFKDGDRVLLFCQHA
ncbi:hypothetical protein M409DRAFT_26102 [Zasmidium cellare ATCC 36951]|uniref:D-serine dehydratase n=1 Tax=Zasmidium cellare ATCC 36951 TaxID=1080233 RepID=A0A6A6CBB0_ZASCE|nr:uncharacterized protein M409DRAFT_26102 [Zasmidium cellare ATCC 36951]KAF2163490.1 hypothetical protein M409DRAFT_26102 [Zasmidium cellare ATCC 36951]